MKISAFIRAKSAKNNVTDKATIYFRVRDDRTRTDIKAASELTINPNHWSSERQGYRGRVALVPPDVQLQLNRSVMEITSLISKEFYIGASNKWLQQLIFAYHHPNAYKISNGEIVETSLAAWGRKFVEERKTDKHQASNYRGVIDKMERFEKYQRSVRKVKDYAFALGSITAEDLSEFKKFVEQEHQFVDRYPSIYGKLDNRTRGKIRTPRGGNTVTNIMTMVRTIVNWALLNGAQATNPFDRFDMPTTLYGTPYYLTIAERDKILEHDFTDNPMLEEYRDMFIFQCMVGCRYGDLICFTTDNIIDGVLEYIPQKTRNKVGASVRVPLGAKALAIINRLNRKEGEVLFPLHFNFKYNDAIRDILTKAGVNRIVTVIDTVTHLEVKRPINEIASSHMARRTFIGNLYKQVKDPNLIASMSGHVAGSKAFARYRAIDDDMKKELIDLID